MNRTSSRSKISLNAASSEARIVEGTLRPSTSVTGEARSESWRKRQNSLTFSRLNTLNPDVFNEPRLSRVSNARSVSSFEGAGGGGGYDAVASRGSLVQGSQGDNVGASFSSGLDKSGLPRLFRIPKFFDGSNESSFMKLEFQDEELEELYRKSEETSARALFRLACGFLVLSSFIHALFFGISAHRNYYVIELSCYAILVLIFLGLSFSERCRGPWENRLTYALAASLVAAALGTISFAPAAFSPVGRFSIATAVLTVLYVFLPLDLPIAISFGVLFSLTFEIAQAAVLASNSNVSISPKALLMKLVLHLCLHFMLASISLLSEVYRRNTFWRIGRSLLYQDQLDFELALKEKIIHSVMPEVIASELLEIDDNAYQSIFKHETSRFRPLMLHRMDDVTILFADIVGFTKMSSTKSASTLVSLLNNLFNRFDKLAEYHGCEKISTLGDCYYCVAGCPAPCDDHADRCVQMGLSMCKAIVHFCRDTGEDVNMRVGIHTGTVLCGIVGVHRFKFDVFSHDVQLANHMESGGVPGMVHMSQSTYDELVDPDAYDIQEGDGASRDEHLKDVTTYLVTMRDRTGMMQRSNSEPTFEPLSPTVRKKRVPSSLRHRPPQSVPVTSNERRKWIASPRQSVSSQTTLSSRNVNSKSLLKVSTIDNAVGDIPNSLYQFDSSSTIAATSIGDILKEREAHEAPRVKVRLSELAATDLLRTAVNNPNSEKGRQEEARRTRLAEQKLVIKVLNSTWDRLIELKQISNKDLHMFSLVFIDEDLEALHRLQFNTPSGVTAHTTFDSPIFSYFLQVVITFIVFLMFSLVLFVVFMPNLSTMSIAAFAACLLFHVAVLLSVGSVCYVRYTWLAQIVRPIVCNWWVAHFIVVFLLAFPAALVATNWPCSVAFSTNDDSFHFNFFILQVSLTMCLLFTQLHRIVQMFVCCGICALLIAFVRVPFSEWPCTDSSLLARHGLNASFYTSGNATGNTIEGIVHNDTFLIFSIYLILIFILNRQYEAASRLNFKSQLLAQVSFEEIQQLKEQADSLLNNLLPDHVCQHLKVSSSYSENHEMVGVIFATICNFSDFYSEHFEGGIGCIRVLNELISDFDDLLCKPEFATVTKIKTIGATYMAASGLNTATRPPYQFDRNQHLKALLEFALEMQRTVRDFNENMVGYEFVLRIGFNCGPVTAGVVGSTKLLFDIWGNTVNVASRMDSTGLPGKIQVPDDCVERLQSCIAFTERPGTVFVKGKGDMVTHFVDSLIWPHPHRFLPTSIHVDTI
ncbi:adenylate cyclase type 9-like [Sycon ciliatum]|uniref:adenylate cyclase type 9-like n=1 Tax=Sycon ciliatum TaxID=27933 RepID=UPI0031F6F807